MTAGDTEHSVLFQIAAVFNDFEVKTSPPKGAAWNHDADRPFLTDFDTNEYLAEKAK